jgi:hypothetical protein
MGMTKLHTDRGGKPINESVKLKFPTELSKILFMDWGDLKAYIVDGKTVREGYDLDFTEGGNFGKYAFVPSNEIWLDNQQGADEVLPTLLHELIEYGLISGKNKSYLEAHKEASIRELKARKKPETLKELVEKEAKSLLTLLDLGEK